MAYKAIDRAYLKDALQSYNERLDDAVVGALTTDIIGEDDATTGAKKGIQTLTVLDNSDTTIDPIDREYIHTIVPAINELDRQIGDNDLTVIDNMDPSVLPADRPVIHIISDAINELDRKQGDADLTVIDTTADPAEIVAKDNISDAINVLDREVGDCATITIEDTTDPIYNPEDPSYDPTAVLKPEIEVVSSLNVLDKELGDANTITVIDVLAGEDKPKKVAVEAINVLDKEMGDDELTVVDTTADPTKTDAETEARAAINVLDKEMGDMATSTVVDTLAADYDPAAPVTKKVAIEAINVLDAEMGELVDNKVIDTVNAKTEPEKTVVSSLNVLDTDLGDVNTLTVKLEDGTLTKEAVAAINRLDEVQGDDVLTVIDTKEGEVDATKVITTAINILDKELGENKDIIADINKRDTIVDALNSIMKQSVLAIEEVPIDPTDPDYSKIEHRYAFKQNFPAGTDPEIPTNVIQTIDIEKPKFVKEVTTFRYEGDPVIVDPQTGEELVLHHLYMKLVIENQEDPLYLDIDHLITDFIVEDTDRVDLTLETREESGERIRVVSADIVPNSLKYSEFVDEVNKELRFTGFDHQIDTSMGEHYEICTDSTYGALLVVTGAPQGNQVALAEVQKINEEAGWGEHIEVGMHVLHKEAIPPATPQLTTTAQNLREAVNELDEKQGDEVITVVDETGALTTTLSAAVNALDAKQGDEELTTTAQTISGAINEHDAEIGDLADLTTTAKDTLVNAINELDAKQGDDPLTVVDTLAGETTAKTDLSAAVNVLDKEMGDINTLTVAKADGTILKEVAQAINQLDLVQGDDVILVVDAAGTAVTTLTAAVNALEDRFPVKIEEVAAEDLNPGIKAAYKVTEGTSTPVDLGLIEIPYSNYDGDPNPVTVKVTVTNDDDNRIIGAEVVEGSIGRAHLDEAVNDELDFLDKSTVLTTTENDSVTKAINEVNLMKDVTVEEKANPGAGVAKAFDIKQKDATGTDVVKGTIEIPFSNYDGEDTDTIDITVDNTDGNRKISASVIDASIDHQQLTEGINQTLEIVPEKVTYKDSVSYLDFTGSYKDFAKKNDLYIITTDFTTGGKTYNAGTWAICTEVFASGDRTWRYINNGGKSTIVRAITNPGDIREEYQEGKEVITDIINHQEDPMDTMYMVAVEQAGGLHAPHHGIYLKTGDIGQTAVAEIFDFGIGGGEGVIYTGSTGANVVVTVTNTGATGTIGASIVAGSLGKGLMDAEVNAILNFTGYPTTLTTAAQTLAGGVNEHDAELGDIVNAALEIKDGSKNNVADILKTIAKNNLTWEGSIATTAATTTINATVPMKKGYVFNVTGVESTINGVACKPGDWLVVTADASVGALLSFIKLGSSGGDAGYNDAGPLIIFS